MTQHCTSCRKNKDPSEFVEDGIANKTCNMCRLRKNIRRKKIAIEKNLNRNKSILEQCRRLAIKKGGECLSDEYKNGRAKMRWRCSEGHEWDAIFENVKNCGSWCLQCSGNAKHTLEKCQQFAESKNGKCLSTEYVNANANMRWRCSEGHEWDAAFAKIKNKGSWCAHCCGMAKHTLEQCQQFAIDKGGECLSTEYISNKTKMRWRCSDGHEWDAKFGDIKNGGTWCSHCVGKVLLTIEECQQFAIEKGGECLSTEYVNNKTKMRWKCNKGHEWDAKFGGIKNCGYWCSQCSGYRSEELCRDIFETHLVEEFPKRRPEWLEGLELDGYNEEVNIAFEYNGIQHYEYNEHFHRGDYERFEAQKARDLKKYRICRERNVDLIIIPYQYDYTNPTELEDFIFNELCKRC
jgi:hypothetical protein